MIKIVKEKPTKRKSKPYYELVFDYMIGDADGDKQNKIKVSADNPHIERFCKLLNKLKPVKGRWGLILNEEVIDTCLDEKQLTKEEHAFLTKLMFEYYGENDVDFDDEEVVQPKRTKHEMEFFDGIEAETEYSFLVFEGVTVYYVDENKKRHKTKFVKG